MDQSAYFVIYIPALTYTSLVNGNDVVWPLDMSSKMKIYFNNYIKSPLVKIFSKKNQPLEKGELDLLEEYIISLGNKNLKPGSLDKNNNNIIELFKRVLNKNNYYIFTYDWRKGINEIVDDLRTTIQKLQIDNDNIALVSHSGGGVIAYKYINGPKPICQNFNKINKFITIGCPIQGSIKALSLILGKFEQHLISGNNLKTIIQKGNIEPVYELLPTRILSCFYDKKTHNHLSSEKIYNILLQNGFEKQQLDEIVLNRKEMNNLTSNENVKFVFINGIYTKKPMCVGFYVDPDTDKIENIYNYGSGDGTVLLTETIPNIDKYRLETVVGKHSFLTEYDDVLDILEEELSNKFVGKPILLATIVKNDKHSISFYLYIVVDNQKYLVKDLKAERITFTLKTFSHDITNKLEHNKENEIFFFKTGLDYGLLKIKNANITYLIEDEKRYINIKRSFVELDKYESKLLF